MSDNRFLIVFALLASLMGTSVGVAKIVTTFYAIELGANAEQLGLLAAGQVVGTLVMSIPIGFLVDHLGTRRLFIAGSLLAGLTYALIPIAATSSFLLGSTTAISFFMPLRFVALNTVFFEQIRRMGQAKAGWYRGTHLSGQFLIGPAVAVSLISLLGYAGAWWMLAASFALTIAVCPLVLARSAPKAAVNLSDRPNLRRAAAEFGLLARDRELRTICLVDVCVEGVVAYQTTFIVAIALQIFGMDAVGASAFVTGTGLSFILTLLLLGAPIARFGARRSYLLGFGMAIGALMTLASASSPAMLWPGVISLGISMGILQTVTLSRAAEIGARLGQGKVSGLIVMTYPIGGILGGLLGGWAGERLGLQSVFYAFVSVFMVLFAWQWRLRTVS